MGIRNPVTKFIVIALLLFILSTATAHPSELTIHFIDIGDGDSIFIITPSEENILIDVGSPSSGIRVIQYLKSLGTKRIDHLILTHPHYDHIGGIFGLISEFKVIRFYDNGFSNFKDDIYRDYVTVIRKDLSRYKILQAGESLHLGDVRIDIITPLLPPTGNPNADSIVMKVIYGDIKVLLAGDINYPTENRLIKLGLDLKSHILKVAHHGENDSTSEDFLDAVKPEDAVISVGKSNIYARPDTALLKRLRERGIRIRRTDRDGSIIVKTDGKTYTIEKKTIDTRD